MRAIAGICILVGISAARPCTAAGESVRAGPSPDSIARAVPILNEAFRTAQRVERDRDRSFLIRSIIGLGMKAQASLDRSLEIARTIPDDGVRAQAVADIALALAKRDPEGALELVRSIEEDRWRIVALLRLAVALAPARALEVIFEAWESARRIQDAQVRARALMKVAEALVGKDPARTEQVAEEALSAARASRFNQTSLVGSAAAVLARTNLDKALVAAESIRGRHGRDQVRHAIVRSLISRDPSRAFQVAVQMEHPRDRDMALRLIADGLARSDPEAALEIARSIGDPGAGADEKCWPIERFG